jgi:hypothetical protein
MLPVRDCGTGQSQDSPKSDSTKKSISERAKAEDLSLEGKQSELAGRASALTLSAPLTKVAPEVQQWLPENLSISYCGRNLPRARCFRFYSVFLSTSLNLLPR